MSRTDRVKKAKFRQKHVATQKALEMMVVWKRLLPLFTPDEVIATYAVMPAVIGTDGAVSLELVRETYLKATRAILRTATPEELKVLGFEWLKPEEVEHGD